MTARAEAPESARPAAARGWVLTASLGAVLVLMRAPSLIEPPQLADEGIYSDLGWALDHGAVLYRTVWDHQPPGVYWLAAAIDALHTSVFAFHVVATAFVVLSIGLIWLLARRLASERVAWVAAFAFAIVASLPTLQGDLLNTEVVGACLVLGAMLTITSSPHALRYLGAGALLGSALLFKPAFVADAIGLAVIPTWIAIASGRRAGRAELRAAELMVAGGAAVVACATGVLALGGSLGGLLNVLLQQDLTYLGSSTAGNTVAIAPSGDLALLTALTATRTFGVILVGLVATVVLARRHHAGAAIVVWWLALDLASAMVSARGFAHYAEQAEPVVCIAAAMVVAASLPRWRSVIATASVATIGAWAVCVVVVLAPTVEEAVALRQPLPGYWSAVIAPRAVLRYVSGGWERIAGLISESRYDAGFEPNTGFVITAVALIDSHSRIGDRVFVWGQIPWVYSLSARMSAGEYVSLNSSYVSDPGSQARLIAELTARPPTVFIATGSLPEQAQALLADDGYTEIPTIDGERCWVRNVGG